MHRLFYLIAAIFFLFSFSVYAEQSYTFNLHYNNGAYSYDNLSIQPTTEPQFFTGGYVAEIVDSDFEQLDTIFFDIPLTIIYHPINDDGEIDGSELIELTEQTVHLSVPYFENANRIIIYDLDLTPQLFIDVSEVSDSLPEEENNAAVVQEVVIPEKKQNSNILLFGILAIVLVIGIVILLMIRRNRSYA